MGLMACDSKTVKVINAYGQSWTNEVFASPFNEYEKRDAGRAKYACTSVQLFDCKIRNGNG